MYSAKEQTPACLRGDIQVVLVGAGHFKDLLAAYPSYFLDVSAFIGLLDFICER